MTSGICCVDDMSHYCLYYFSISPHHTMYAGQNRSIGRGWRNDVGGFGGGADFLFEALGGFGVSLVGFEVDGALKLG